MLDAAADALQGHGTRPEGDTCLCGHSGTPVRRHLAEIVANAIGPALSVEVMSALSEALAQTVLFWHGRRKKRT
jgi:hypothetical protein